MGKNSVEYRRLNMEEKKHNFKSDRAYYLFALRIIGDFGIAIAAPVVVFSYLGQKIDAYYNSSPWFLIVGFALSIILSTKIIYRKAKKYGKEYQNL